MSQARWFLCFFGFQTLKSMLHWTFQRTGSTVVLTHMSDQSSRCPVVLVAPMVDRIIEIDRIVSKGKRSQLLQAQTIMDPDMEGSDPNPLEGFGPCKVLRDQSSCLEPLGVPNTCTHTAPALGFAEGPEQYVDHSFCVFLAKYHSICF